ncbi:MAG: LamG domain-containing protein, partial [Opitutae bacterium]
MKFDGSGDYIATPDSEDFYLPGDFTIEGWVYPTSSTGINVIVAQWREQGGSDRNFSIRSDDGIFYMNRAGTNKSVTLGAFSLNQWTHFAVAVENGTCYGFINGVLQDSNPNFTAAANNSTQPLGIGAYGNGDYVFEGYIDDLRITKGVARYTSNFTPPTQPFFNNFKTGADQYFYSTSLLLKGDGTNGSTTIVDSSPSPKTVTAVGNAQISTAQSKFGGSSIKLSEAGNTGHVFVDQTPAFGTEDWTI